MPLTLFQSPVCKSREKPAVNIDTVAGSVSDQNRVKTVSTCTKNLHHNMKIGVLCTMKIATKSTSPSIMNSKIFVFFGTQLCSYSWQHWLQAMIKRSLQESGCPVHIVNELMENAHERRWPPGLQTLETRQMNRRQYEQYVCKRIQGKQAVVVMACDNTHISDDMILEPGLVMIFAHGIE